MSENESKPGPNHQGHEVSFTDYVDITNEPETENLPADPIDPQSDYEERQQGIDEARAQLNKAAGPDEGPSSAEHIHEASLLDRLYQSLRARESQPPDPDRTILVRDLSRGQRGLSEAQPEYAVLLDHGVTAETLASGRITRRELLEAGYVFLNKLGGGEKAVISGEIPDPDDPANILDFTNRVLLTREEVDKVYRHQLAHPDIFGAHGQDLNEVRKDMLIFLGDAIYQPPFRSELEFLNAALPNRLNDFVHVDHEVISSDSEYAKVEKDWETVEEYWKWQVQHYEQINPDTTLNDLQIRHHLQKVFSQQFCDDIYEWPGDPAPFGIKDVRGHRINRAIRERQSKLRGLSSPFLESGFVFDDNPDAEVIVELPSGKSGKRRLNMANLHLFGAHPDFPGFSEMGGDDDQIYMTLGTYVDSLYPKDANQRAIVQGQELAKLQPAPIGRVIIQYQERLVARAKSWHEAQLAGSEDEFTKELQELQGADIEAVRQHEQNKRDQEERTDQWL